jgi:uracil-DNA glycosylase family 4
MARECLGHVEEEVVRCRLCPRLVAWREEVARRKAPRYRDQTYWGRPVPGFGDPRARVLLVGLAPGAHGGNRTGRIFTGDSSGDFLYPALHRAGFASQPDSSSRGDGMRLKDMWISAAVKCVPPDNRPAPDEIARCRPYLTREWDALSRVAVVLCLGHIAHDAALACLAERGLAGRKSQWPFAHGAVYRVGGLVVVDSYHVSRQNTNTGRLTAAMFDAVLARVATEAKSAR